MVVSGSDVVVGVAGSVVVGGVTAAEAAVYNVCVCVCVYVCDKF